MAVLRDRRFTNFYPWKYWWNDPTTGAGGCAPNLCRFTDPAAITEWQAIEAGN